jgi:hypothetical protein
MSWFKRNRVPEVTISGDRFSIAPLEAEVIDAEVVSPNLPAVRRSEPPEPQQTRQGTIPAHSWGS